MVMMMMQQQQNSSAPPQPCNPARRSPTSTTTQSTHGPTLPRQAIPLPIADHVIGPVVPISVEPAVTMPARVRLEDMTPYDGAPCGSYVRAVEALSGSLMRHNAAVIELGSQDAAVMRCGLEAARLYFRTKSQSVAKGSRGVYMYRAGR
ncbi:hypothetical protein Patl1_15792 [Pistacia atlantica]|uniref:Uncharacterized protein n=1 Tax=Pistacia atlantica TaxID=434234 RepID=A0ACC1BB27_9ROSI|nr:hypothetical protein Patl1_15792 [Pistacia atlantica]